MSASKGYNTRAYVSNAPGAFYNILASDFGAPAPGAPTLLVETATGSLTTGTAYVEITWVTAEGVSLPSVQVAAAVPANTDGMKVTRPSVPAVGQQTVTGWQIYSAASSGSEALNTTGLAGATPTTVITTSGSVTGVIPVATTNAIIQAYGTGAAPALVDRSGIQPALPTNIASDSSVVYYAIIPNTGSQWKQQKSVEFMRSDTTLVPDGGDAAGVPPQDPAGIMLNHLDYMQPTYPGSTLATFTNGAWTPSSTYTQFTLTAANVSAGVLFVMNGYLFQATAAGTSATNFIGWAAFNTTKFGNTTDGTITWQCLGKAGLMRFSFANVSASSQSVSAQDYEFFQS